MIFSPEILLGYASHCSAVRLRIRYAQDDIYYVTLEDDDVDRSLDDARDDSGAVNSPSTTLGMTFLRRMTLLKIGMTL